MATPSNDPFATLSLPPTATREEAKAAFRRLALKCHPDIDSSPSAASRFAEVKRAADQILKYEDHHTHTRPAGGWQHYTHTAADWRPRSRSTALWLCAATLVAGCGVFYGALVSHEWLFSSYTWLSPAEVERRPRRHNLLRLMMEQQQGEQQQQGETGQQAQQEQQQTRKKERQGEPE